MSLIFSIFLAYFIFLLFQFLPFLLSSSLLIFFNFLRESLFSFYSFLHRQGKLTLLFPFLFTFYYIFVYAYEHRRWIYDFALFLSLFSILWSNLLAILILRYLFIFGFTLPLSSYGFFLFSLVGLFLSFFRIWVSLSLAFYRSSSLWNFSLLENLWQDYILLAKERPFIRALFHFSHNPSYNHLPPPHLPKPPVDGWTHSQVIGGMVIGGVGVFVSGGVLYYARKQSLSAEAQSLATQDLVKEKVRKNDIFEYNSGLISHDEYHRRRDKG